MASAPPMVFCHAGVPLRCSSASRCPIVPSVSPGLPLLRSKSESDSPTSALIARCAARLYESGPLAVLFSALTISVIAALTSASAASARACPLAAAVGVAPAADRQKRRNAAAAPAVTVTRALPSLLCRGIMRGYIVGFFSAADFSANADSMEPSLVFVSSGTFMLPGSPDATITYSVPSSRNAAAGALIVEPVS